VRVCVMYVCVYACMYYILASVYFVHRYNCTKYTDALCTDTTAQNTQKN
jgi:hypothetical protein